MLTIERNRALIVEIKYTHQQSEEQIQSYIVVCNQVKWINYKYDSPIMFNFTFLALRAEGRSGGAICPLLNYLYFTFLAVRAEGRSGGAIPSA